MTAIKPEIYISWIPRGNINVKTQIFASIIPSEKVFTQAKAATNRRVANFERTTANTLRKVGNAENFQADSLRVVKKVETVHGDTSRKLGITVVKGDTCRQVKNICETKADTLRKIGVWEKISAITLRNVKVSEKVFADTLRKFAKLETVNADTSRKLIEKISAATVRKVVIPEKFFADTVVRVPHKLNYFVQPVLMKSAGLLADSANASSIVNTFKDCNVTSFSVTLREKTLSDVFEFQAAHDFNINDAINGQLLDYQFNFLVEEISQQGILQTIKGMYNQDEILYERIRTATTTITHRQKKNKTGYSKTSTSTSITYFSAGSILDSLAYQMGFTANMKFDDFIPYNITADSNTTYASYLSSLFGWTSKLPQRQINVFIRGGVLHVIQRGCEETVFDITDLPHSQPTVDKKILRTMWQSGDYEEEIDDDDDDDPTDGEWSEEEIAQPFNGAISFQASGTSVSLEYERGLLMRENHTSSHSSSKTTYSYKEFFPAGTSELEIWLHKLTGDFYLESKHTYSFTEQSGAKQSLKNYNAETEEADPKRIKTWTDTEYIYSGTNSDDIYLVAEKESNESVTFEYKEQEEKNSYGRVVGSSRSWVETNAESHSRNTYHEPIGNGWYGQAVYVDGEAQGSNVSQGKPGNKISQYTINEVRKTFTYATITPDPGKDPNNPETGGDSEDSIENEYKKMRAQLAPTADITFPVREFETIFELTQALIWLNRKTQEEISVDVIDKIVGGVPTINHIIDFTERIKFNGNEYYLVSNQIRLTTRKLIQSLKLVRWY